MNSVDIDFHDNSTMSDLADADSSDCFEKVKNAGESMQKIVKDKSPMTAGQGFEDPYDRAAKRKMYARAESFSMYCKTPGKPPMKACKF